jgi:hypothetical protein
MTEALGGRVRARGRQGGTGRPERGTEPLRGQRGCFTGVICRLVVGRSEMVIWA